ncbi:MAG: sugar phosphate isomerase/epimerase [Planctomycetota bacterium]|jgi:2-keto-myo-inositol isomerase|nr:sugar phosphate isomerase/epimerase [Planctomycetota bacterium]
MAMKLGINGSTLENCGVSEFLDIAAQAGYGGVELRMPKIDEYLKSKTFDDLRAELAKTGMRVISLNSIEYSTMQTEAEHQATLAEVDKFARYAAELSCPWLIGCPGECPDSTPWDEIVTKSGAQLARLADTAWKYRVNMAFEFVGFPGRSAKTPSQAWAIVKEANRGNLGITVDVANFHSGRGLLSELSALPAGAVAVYHINDLRNMPPEKAGAYDRVMPGDGISPVAEISRELKRIGYNGYACVEIFNHDYNRRDPLGVAGEAFEKSARFVR